MADNTTTGISRELMGKIVDEVFEGAIEDCSVIEEIYAAIKRHEAEEHPTTTANLRVTEAMVNAADSVLSRSRPGIPDETIRFAIEAAIAAACMSPVPQMTAAAKRWLLEEHLPGGSIRWQCYEHEHQSREVAKSSEHKTTVTPLYSPPAPQVIVTAEDYNAAFDPANAALGGAFKDGFREGWLFAKDQGFDDREELEADYSRAVDIAPSECWDAYRSHYFAMLPLAAIPDVGEAFHAPAPQAAGQQ